MVGAMATLVFLALPNSSEHSPRMNKRVFYAYEYQLHIVKWSMVSHFFGI